MDVLSLGEAQVKCVLIMCTLVEDDPDKWSQWKTIPHVRTTNARFKPGVLQFIYATPKAA